MNWAGWTTLFLVLALGMVVFRAVVGPPPESFSYLRIAWLACRFLARGVIWFVLYIVLISVVPAIVEPLMERFASSTVQSWDYWWALEWLVDGLVYTIIVVLTQRALDWRKKKLAEAGKLSLP